MAAVLVTQGTDGGMGVREPRSRLTAEHGCWKNVAGRIIHPRKSRCEGDSRCFPQLQVGRLSEARKSLQSRSETRCGFWPGALASSSGALAIPD